VAALTPINGIEPLHNGRRCHVFRALTSVQETVIGGVSQTVCMCSPVYVRTRSRVTDPMRCNV